MLYCAIQEEILIYPGRPTQWRSHQTEWLEEEEEERWVSFIICIRKTVLIPNNLYSVQSILSVQATPSTYSRFLKFEGVLLNRPHFSLSIPEQQV